MAADEKDPLPEGEETLESDAEEALEPSTDIVREDPKVEDVDDEETEDASFDITVKDEGPCEKTVTVEVPADVVDEEIANKYDGLKTSMPMRGFRKGRIPQNLLARRYGKQVREEVRSNLISRGVVKAIKDKGLEPLSYPEVDDEDVEIEKGKAMCFTFRMDVRPVVDVKDYLGVEVEKPSTTVSAEDVDAEVENIRLRLGTLEPVEDTPSTRGDHLVVTLDFILEGRSVQQNENVPLPLPKEEDAEIYKSAPWVAAALDRKPGETYEAEYTFPNEFAEKKARGKKGALKVKVEEVKRLHLPEMGEAFFRTAKVENEEELRTRIETQLKESKEAAARGVMEKRILEKILEATPVELPERIIEKNLDSQLRKAELRLRESGVSEEDIPERIETLTKERREEMAREYRSFFLLEEISKLEKIYVTEDDVKARVELLAYNYGKWPQQMEQELNEQGLMDELRTNIKEEKVLSFLRKKATVTEEAGTSGA